MRNRVRTVLVVATVGLAAAVVAACGSSSSSSGGGVAKVPLKPGENPVGQQLTGKKKGGTLTVYTSGDFQHLDPGQAYYTLDYPVAYATQRPLVSYLPNTSTTLSPDLAAAMPTVSADGKTVTFHIRHGVHFSPPVNREVTSADVAFAIERTANPNVGGAYFPTYFGAQSPAPLVGAEGASYKGTPIPGITTPDKYTIVFHLSKPGAQYMIQALTLPGSAPVPPEFVKPLDKHSPTTYGTGYLVATGPYMIETDSKGKVTGYQTGKSAALVRNPNWSAATDFRPAYLDQINVNIGGAATVIGQQVLKGSHAVELDTPPQSIVKLAYQQYPAQITFTPGAGDHYAALDQHHGVFKNVNLRRAVWAALDRNALIKAIGGPLVGQPMTHFIYPGGNGFQEAGGYPGPQFDFNKNPNGDMTVAAKYMKAAGYPGGKYTGSETVQVVGQSTGNGPPVTQIVNQTLTNLGFKTHVSLVDQSVLYSKYCGVPKQEIDVCPTVGWVRDFADPLSALYVPFYGPGIVPTNNSNWGQVNIPQVNAAMIKASLVVDPAAHAQAWGNVDRMLVDQAVAAPEEFDNQPNIESKDVAGVNQLWNVGEWDFSYTSLK